ncbi:hypothetical protein HIM_03501 [Hirsutella minnesotensis 3608]|uniref:GH16 domain-containing protein n=1 Tax=Hirsutella minnesotensis 3608 TaxID=1043627 RepID=A0A0F7ZQF9_9HYPO|nr:hypothetical protein HIM_03501 [Hirsutella minnesotensis 3608]
MLSPVLLVVYLAVLVSASLKDLANCDPLRKDTNCPPDPAFAGKAKFDFAAARWDDNFNRFWAIDNDTAHDQRRLNFKTDGKGLAMSVHKAGDAPTLTSHKYLLFGKVSVTLKAAKGPGVITALVLKSDSGDEIDWVNFPNDVVQAELLGAYDNQAASNYFYDGKALFNTYNTTYRLNTSSFDDYHTYGIEWTPDRLVFSIDGQARRTWRSGEIPPGRWPQTPMHVKVGVWAVAKGGDAGEIAWAGGVPDWKRGPFTAHFAALDVEDHMGGCSRAEGPVRYEYNERTWGWQHVLVDGCTERVAGADLASPRGSAGSKPSKTAHSGHGQPEPSGTSEAQDDAAATPRLSSPLAAVLCLCWLLIL